MGQLTTNARRASTRTHKSTSPTKDVVAQGRVQKHNSTNVAVDEAKVLAAIGVDLEGRHGGSESWISTEFMGSAAGHGKKSTKGQPQVVDYLPTDEEADRREVWGHTHVPPTAEEASGSGRKPGRNLLSWHRPATAEKLLLHLQYELSRHKIEVPWASVAHRLRPGTTANAVHQHLHRVRLALIAEGHLVPPPPPKQNARVTGSSELRGYVRRSGDPQDKQVVRPVTFGERLVDASVNFADAAEVTSELFAHEATETSPGESPGAPVAGPSSHIGGTISDAASGKDGDRRGSSPDQRREASYLARISELERALQDKTALVQQLDARLAERHEYRDHQRVVMGMVGEIQAALLGSRSLVPEPGSDVFVDNLVSTVPAASFMGTGREGSPAFATSTFRGALREPGVTLHVPSTFEEAAVTEWPSSVAQGLMNNASDGASVFEVAPAACANCSRQSTGRLFLNKETPPADAQVPERAPRAVESLPLAPTWTRSAVQEGAYEQASRLANLQGQETVRQEPAPPQLDGFAIEEFIRLHSPSCE